MRRCVWSRNLVNEVGIAKQLACDAVNLIHVAELSEHGKDP